MPICVARSIRSSSAPRDTGRRATGHGAVGLLGGGSGTADRRPRRTASTPTRSKALARGEDLGAVLEDRRDDLVEALPDQVLGAVDQGDDRVGGAVDALDQVGVQRELRPRNTRERHHRCTILGGRASRPSVAHGVRHRRPEGRPERLRVKPGAVPACRAGVSGLRDHMTRPRSLPLRRDRGRVRRRQRLMLTSSSSTWSEVVITREVAWKPRWAMIRLVNSCGEVDVRHLQRAGHAASRDGRSRGRRPGPRPSWCSRGTRCRRPSPGPPGWRSSPARSGTAAAWCRRSRCR